MSNTNYVTAIHTIFHIIDVEFNDEYDYDAWFINAAEHKQFIKENQDAGNTITITASTRHRMHSDERDRLLA